jgi:predicted ATP-binding protein involved in virulence
MLKKLQLKGLCPAPQIDLDCASQLNILTGDNELGKTFLLDIIGRGLRDSYPVYRNAD